MSPIPERVGAGWYIATDSEHLDRSTVEIKRSLWPRTCYKSKRLLWFCLAYRARRIITGPGEPVVEDRWYDPAEFLILKLKGY
jgi:hypothetical protein